MPYKCRGCSKEYKTKTPFIKHEKECNTNVKLSNAISMSHYKKYTDELEYMEKDRLQRMAALKQLQKQNDERNLRHKSQTQTAGAVDVEAAVGEIIQTQTQTQTQTQRHTQNEVQLTDIKDAENYANQFATPGTRYTLAQSTNMAGPRFTITTSTTSVSPGQQNINMKITPTLCLSQIENYNEIDNHNTSNNDTDNDITSNTRGTQTSVHDIPRQPYDPNNRPVLSKEGIVLEKDWEKHLANIGEEDADGVITFEKMTLLVLALIEKNKELQADNDAMKLEMVKFEIIKKALIGTLGSK